MAIHRLAWLLSFALTSIGVACGAAQDSPVFIQKLVYSNRNDAIAVMYSDIGEPYRTVYMQIIAGVEDKTKSQISAYPVGGNTDSEMIKGNLRVQGAKVVISLGWQSMKTAIGLDSGLGLVISGVVDAPETETRGFPVYSLSPDPALLFSRSKELMPSVRRIHTVYDPNKNQRFIDLAKRAALNQGLELVAREAPDLRSAMDIYQEIFKSASSRGEALWLLQDSTTVEDGSVLPMVLRESWDRNLAVFSSNPGHVRRGVLFSLYPDNVSLGRHLADTALKFLASGDYAERGTILLRDVQMAINLRTAQHLELNIGSRQNFGMVFPEQ
ncbi:MAG: ABC transporter substrate binding protein [Methylomonas sp.]|nr:ABC transporter substrate binding protein [Methylomonas sp.]